MNSISLIFQNISSFNITQRQQASSLIELLVVISLSLFLSLVGYQVLKTSIAIKKVIGIDYQKSYQAVRLKSLIEDIIQDLSWHTLPIEPKIFGKGEINIDGDPFLLSSDPLKLPNVRSDAISYLSLDYSHLIHVTLNENLILEGCSDKLIPNILYNFIGIDLGGVSYFQGYARKIAVGCYQFQVIQMPNLILAKRHEKFPIFTKILIPVVDEYLVYVDRTNQLRYVTLKGLNILENQPVFEDAPDLSLSLIKYEQVWQLDLRWKYPEQLPEKEFKQVGTARLARQSLGNLLLNL